MSKTSILYTVYNNYCTFRTSIESLFANINSDDYNQIIIANDCSNQKELLEFLEYLNNLPNVSVINMGEPSDHSYYRFGRGRGPCPEGKTMSKGHGFSINAGLEQVVSDFVFVVDSDMLFLPKCKTLINQLEKRMNLNADIMVAGQLIGNLKKSETFDTPFFCPKIGTKGGWIHSCAMFCRMAGWTNHNLSKFRNGAWAQKLYVKSIFENKLKTCNMNLFGDSYLIHLGGAIVTVARDRPKHKRPCLFGFAKNGKSSYAGKQKGELVDWYAGHTSIKLTTEEFINLSSNEYVSFPFNERKNILPQVV